jgi:isoquinoline 1-oxidoreductase beta subunit
MTARSSRRAVLIGGGALGLLVGVGAWTATSRPTSLAGVADKKGVFLHDWLHVGLDGVVTLRVGQSEMGQGAFTGVATLVAEELGCRLERMRIETGPASDAFKNLAVTRDGLFPERGFALARPPGFVDAAVDFGLELVAEQITGGSSTIAAYFTRARMVGAGARAMLVQAATLRWRVPAGECAAEDGEVVHVATGRRLTFGELAYAAGRQVPPAITLKPRADWKLIGSPSIQRVDLPAKTDGSAIFGIDVRRPGMLFAAVRHCPTFGGSLSRFDAAKAEKMPGVVSILRLGDGVAAIADSTWRAQRALDAVDVIWDRGPAQKLDSAAIDKTLAAAVRMGGGAVESVGDFAAALEKAAKRLAAEYAAPYLAHATMEPMNCTAEVRDDGVDVWAPTQAQTRALEAAAGASGFAAKDARIHTTLLGGGFGRRLDADYVAEAVTLSRAVGRPVQVIWSREEDMRRDFYRPAARIRVEAGLDGDGRAKALRVVVASQSILARWYPLATWLQRDPLLYEGAAGSPYAIPNRRVESVRVDLPVPVGSWRSVGHSYTAFATESFMDEMAREAGADPVAFRLGLLKEQPRLAALLRLVASKARWGAPMPPGKGRGVALHMSFQSACAQVVEVTVEGGALRVDRVFAAIDCGTMINPDNVRAQVEGAILFGLSAALHGEITIKGGAVEQSNFDDYPVVTMDRAPRIEVYLTPSDAPPGGAGEPGLPPLAPALANAIFAATGTRVRALPIGRQGFQV